MKTNEILVALVILNDGNWDKVYKDLVEKSLPTDEKVNEIVSVLERENINYITIMDSEYPNCLKETHKPPFVLFYEGDINLLKGTNEMKLAISSTKYGDSKQKKTADLILEGNNSIYVLGGESEIDAHLISKADNKKIIVLNQPLSAYDEKLKAKVIKDGGLLITEYHNHSPLITSNERTFARCRYMAMIGEKVLILYATQQSPQNILIHNALTYGRDILVVPVAPTDTEYVNNQFIYEGAIPVWKSEILQNELREDI